MRKLHYICIATGLLIGILAILGLFVLKVPIYTKLSGDILPFKPISISSQTGGVVENIHETGNLNDPVVEIIVESTETIDQNDIYITQNDLNKKRKQFEDARESYYLNHISLDQLNNIRKELAFMEYQYNHPKPTRISKFDTVTIINNSVPQYTFETKLAVGDHVFQGQEIGVIRDISIKSDLQFKTSMGSGKAPSNGDRIAISIDGSSRIGYITRVDLENQIIYINLVDSTSDISGSCQMTFRDGERSLLRYLLDS
ncbi:MAG: hypothetical protein KJP00_03845 [Bacteroidia bacterium]|nr:hypothetical protein [Bacteroidia bacterium]